MSSHPLGCYRPLWQPLALAFLYCCVHVHGYRVHDVCDLAVGPSFDTPHPAGPPMLTTLAHASYGALWVATALALWSLGIYMANVGERGSTTRGTGAGPQLGN